MKYSRDLIWVTYDIKLQMQMYKNGNTRGIILY